jgi:hypothetical protein
MNLRRGKFRVALDLPQRMLASLSKIMPFTAGKVGNL